MDKKNNGSISVFLIWLIIFLALGVLVVFGYLISKETNKKKQVENEINSLKAEAEKIRKENMALEERIAYLGSRDYQEIQIKDKLNLKSPQENVVVITQSPVKKEEVQTEIQGVEVEKKKQDKDPNFIKWWNYFFVK
jgi:cell division protein FtsL